jgi:hypothetical protein
MEDCEREERGGQLELDATKLYQVELLAAFLQYVVHSDCRRALVLLSQVAEEEGEEEGGNKQRT